jgi:hypothetical protein
VIFSHVVEHLTDDLGALKQIRAMMHPAALLALLTPNEGCRLTRLGRKFIDPHLAAQTDHMHFYTRSSLRELVRKADYRVLSMRGEVLGFPSYRVHMSLLRRSWGYRLLRLANFLLPSQTSGWQVMLELA